MLLLKGLLHISGSLMQQEEKRQKTVARFNKQYLKSWIHINTKAIGLAAYSELENQASNLNSRIELGTQLCFKLVSYGNKAYAVNFLCTHKSFLLTLHPVQPCFTKIRFVQHVEQKTTVV